MTLTVEVEGTKNMKKTLFLFNVASAAVLAVFPVHANLVVYEGFDYTDGSALAGEGTAVDGWNGAWAGGNWNLIPGQTFGSVAAIGGAVQRPARNGNDATSRDISAASQTALTADGTTIWFSVLMQSTGSPATESGAAGYATNTYGTLVFGDTALSGGSGGASAPMGAGGNAIGVGFADTSDNTGNFDNVQVQGVIYSGGTATQGTADRIVVGTNTTFIVGRVDWAASGTDDTLTLYSVTDPAAAFLPGPFTTLTADLNQSTFNIVSIGDAQTAIFDEIRFGTELDDVSPFGITTSPAPTIAASSGLIEVGSSVDLEITFDPAADTAELETQGGTVDLFLLDDGTNGDLVADDGQVTYTDSPTSTYNYVVESIKGGEVQSAGVEVNVADPSAVPSNAFSAAILNDSPLFYYRFEEAVDAGYLTDVSGNGNHTSDVAGNFTQGTSPGGMQLAGKSELTASILVPATSEMSASFTFVTVMNADDFGGGLLRNVLAMSNGTGIGRSLLYYGTSGFETFISGAGGGASGGVSLSDAGALPVGMSCLIHLVLNADPDEDPLTDDQEISIYVNGQPYGTPAAVGAIGANLGNWVLCSNKNLGTQSHVGSIDETAVFESALSDAQIAAHGTAFLSSADPLLGFTSSSAEVTSGDSVTLDWKISDQATSVEIDGVPQTIAGGGLYSTLFSNLTEDTTYIIEVFFTGGSVTSEIEVVVVEPLVPPTILSITTDTADPPNVTIEIMGAASTTYPTVASADLQDDFPIALPPVTTDETGYGIITFEGFGDAEFYRFEVPE